MEDNKVIIKLKKQPLKSEREEMKQEKKKKIFIVLTCVLLFVLGVFVGGGVAYALKSSGDASAYSKLDEIKSRLKSNWLYRNDYDDLDTTLDDKAFYGMTTFSDDPYTTYMSSEEMNEYANDINMNYVGIGVQYNSYNYTILRVYNDSPAQAAGLLAGDVIKRVDDEDVSGKTNDEIKQMVQGQEGTIVKITVLRDNKEITYDVTRGNVDSTVYAYKYDNTLVLEIMSFGSNTGNECIKYLDEYKDEDRLVIDLRNNTGGYETAVQEVAGIFLGKDKIVMHKVYSDNNIDTDYTISNAYYDNFKKIVILTNGSTASASEVLTMALKEGHDNVTVVGEKTYGKGVMQSSYILNDGSALKVTIAYWTSPDNNSINKTGIVPDVEVKLHDVMYESVSFLEEGTTINVDEVSTYVKTMQLMLDYLDYDVDRTDGYFSNDTLTALNKYRKDVGLDESKVLDEETYSALYSSVISLNRTDSSKDNQLVKAMEIINE